MLVVLIIAANVRAAKEQNTEEYEQALHALRADKDILKGLVKGMSHVELTGYVRRGDYDRKCGLLGIGIGREIATLAPLAVDAVLKVLGIVVFC